MNERCYITCRDNKEFVYGYVDYENIHGFDIKPQNNVPYSGIEVSHLTLVEPELIKNVLKRKIKRKLNTYLNYLMTIVSDDDSDPDSTALVIDDLERYKALIINKYSKFLDKRYLNTLLKKVGFVEKELQRKIKEINFEDNMEIGRRR